MVVLEDFTCTWLAITVMGSEQVNGAVKENGIFKLPKANFQISIQFSLQNSRNQTLLPACFSQHSKGCLSEAV